MLLATSKLRLQRLRYSFGDLALDAKDVSQFAIVAVGPEVGIGLGIDQLHIHPHLVGYLLNAALKNVRYAKLLRDLAEIARFVVIVLRGSA